MSSLVDLTHLKSTLVNDSRKSKVNKYLEQVQSGYRRGWQHSRQLMCIHKHFLLDLMIQFNKIYSRLSDRYQGKAIVHSKKDVVEGSILISYCLYAVNKTAMFIAILGEREDSVSKAEHYTSSRLESEQGHDPTR